jgi:hypothetical protein
MEEEDLHFNKGNPRRKRKLIDKDEWKKKIFKKKKKKKKANRHR